MKSFEVVVFCKLELRIEVVIIEFGFEFRGITGFWSRRVKVIVGNF